MIRMGVRAGPMTARAGDARHRAAASTAMRATCDFLLIIWVDPPLARLGGQGPARVPGRRSTASHNVRRRPSEQCSTPVNAAEMKGEHARPGRTRRADPASIGGGYDAARDRLDRVVAISVAGGGDPAGAPRLTSSSGDPGGTTCR